MAMCRYFYGSDGTRTRISLPSRLDAQASRVSVSSPVEDGDLRFGAFALARAVSGRCVLGVWLEMVGVLF